MYASLFRIIRQAISVAIPFIMKDYLTLARKNQKIEWEYCLSICVIISTATLVRDLFSQSSQRQTSIGRKKLYLIMRSMFYDKLLNSNFEFVSQINTGFVNKMLLFDIDPIAEFICSIPALTASPVTTFFAFFMIWTQISFSWYFFLIVLFYFVTLYITARLIRRSVGLRKQYRATSTAIHGYLYEYIKNIKFIKINSIDSVLMREIWRIRKTHEAILNKLNNTDNLIEMMFFTPTLATSVLFVAF